MGKVNKRKPLKHSNHHDNPHRAKKAVVRRQHSQNVPKNDKSKVNKHAGHVKPKSNLSNGQSSSTLKTPFNKWDRVLLLGEGDFSFTLSLMRNHKVGSIVATCFDSQDVLEQKYPEVSKTIQKLSPRDDMLQTPDVGKENSNLDAEDESDSWQGFSPSVQSDDSGDASDTLNSSEGHSNTMILYGIDATKLSTAHKKVLRPHSPFTKIVFNFPHVGGLSTDVNRQVRANQQLLVEFFNSAKHLLASKTNPARPLPVGDVDSQDENFDYDDETEPRETGDLTHGQILVTLFEGEPYTLWNIRDLARHSGLKVLESFKHPWAAYPGYQHARTIGDITVGKDRSDEGKRKGAWRGEERDARCYILAVKDDDSYPAPGSRKRRKEQDDDD